jgi:hypothetical protein
MVWTLRACRGDPKHTAPGKSDVVLDLSGEKEEGRRRVGEKARRSTQEVRRYNCLAFLAWRRPGLGGRGAGREKKEGVRARAHARNT